MKDDTISRAEALNLVKDVCEAILSGCGSHYDGEDEVYDDLLEVDAILKCSKEIRTALKHMPSAQQWIPISEGLPEMTDTYLVQVGVNENGEGMHTEARTADWNAIWQEWYVYTTYCFVGDIIKWMPIPWKGELNDT